MSGFTLSPFRTLGSVLVTVVWSALASAAQAAESLPFAAPVKPVISTTASSALRVPLALILVLALVLGAAWLMRRLNTVAGGSASRGIQVLAQVSLGARERAVLIKVSGHELLLGVAPGSVRTLMELPPGIDLVAATVPETTVSPPPSLGASFREVLRRSLGR
jgi:flagellar protein FliO/FliZ